MRTYYWTCKDCGANLDPGERCDCQKPSINMVLRDNIDTCVCCSSYVPEGRQVCAVCEGKVAI